MRYRSFIFTSTRILASVFVLLLSVVAVTEAQVRSSSNYQLQSDSINVTGGLTTSASYQQESTIGEIATGRSSSASYSLRTGYQTNAGGIY